MDKKLSPTLEDYLQAIYRIEREKRVARPRDISRAQNVARSTVTAALQSLAEKRLVNYEPYEVVTLTEEGRNAAEEIVIRHSIIEHFLQNILGLEPKRASTNACEMEHAVDQEALERLVCFLAFIEHHSPRGATWLDDFRRFIQEGADGQTCKECVKEYMNTLREESQRETNDDVAIMP